MPVKSKRKKKWIKIIALKPFNEQFIGETFVSETQDAIGRKIRLSLMNLTNNPKNQNVTIIFEITKKHAEGVGAEMTGYNLVASSVKRFVRRGCNRIDESYIFRTADNKKIRIKPFILTRSLTKGSVLKAMRKAVKEFLSNNVQKSSYEKFVNDLLYHKLQKELRDHLKKIYPARVCEIRLMEIEKEKRKSDAGEGKEKPGEKKETKEKKAKEEKEEEGKKEESEEKEGSKKEKKTEELKEEKKEAKEEKETEEPKEEKKEETEEKETKEEKLLDSKNPKDLETKEKKSFSESQKSSISEKSKTFQKKEEKSTNQ